MTNIPRYIYRGDSDSSNDRKLRLVFPGSSYGYLMTNLNNGGNGADIFSSPLHQTINRHVAIGWNKTHYLSFSSDETIAQKYATNNNQSRTIKTLPNVNWDFAITCVDTSLFIQKVEIAAGVFHCSYKAKVQPSFLNLQAHSLQVQIFRSFDKQYNSIKNLMLIDVARYLKSLPPPKFNTAIYNAERDKEWLILPVDSPQDMPSEFSCKIDDGCISFFSTYKYINE